MSTAGTELLRCQSCNVTVEWVIRHSLGPETQLHHQTTISNS